MPNNYPEIKKFLGLFAQQNSFDMPEGAMEKALNVVINDDNVINKIRGFYQYFSPGSGTIRAITLYQNKLMAVYSNKITYFNDTGTAPNLTGTEVTLTGDAFTIASDRDVFFAEANGNLYFTTDNGVMSLDAHTGSVLAAGAAGGLDIRGAFLPINGPINGNNNVGYRCLFGRKDANNNLILGAPSDILSLSNPKKIGQPYTVAGLVVTVTTVNHNLTTGMTVIVADATDVNANGTYTVTVTGADTFTYTATIAPAAGSLAWTTSRRSLVSFSIPREITATTAGWFYRLYRTSLSGSDSIDPTQDYRLLDEVKLTSGDLAAGLITYEDSADDVLVRGAAELYTNPNSQEGELQANNKPPLCDDITVFNNYMFFGKCKGLFTLNLDVISTSDMASGNYLMIDGRKYIGYEGVGNSFVKSEIIGAGPDLDIFYNGHGFSDGFKIYVSSISGASLLSNGFYYIVGSGANHFKLALTPGGTPILKTSEQYIYFEGDQNASSEKLFQIDKTSTSVATRLRRTAQGIIKAVNRDEGALIYGNYVSSDTDVPGKMRFKRQYFTTSFGVSANTTLFGSEFFPVLTTTAGDNSSTSDDEPSVVYVAKVGEPWAVPLLNKFFTGSRNQEIFRILALRNSVMVLKGDGIFKITGDTVNNFTVTLIDNTVRIISRRSAAITANQVYFLAAEGVCIGTDSSVEIVSRRIENRFENVTGLSNIADQTSAVAYDTDRTYRLCTIAPNETSATTVYLHNSINDTWTESDTLFTGGTVGPQNILYLISGNKILKERKNQSRIDYCGQNYSATVVSVASDKLSAVISAAVTPVVGDLIEKGGSFNRIRTVTISGVDFIVTFITPTNLLAADVQILYQGYDSVVNMAPFHGGTVGRSKQFSQVQIHTRTPSISRLKIDFSNSSFAGDKTTVWAASAIKITGGWGHEPWGFFSWGLSDGIKNIYNTVPAPKIRTYVPRFQQRSTYIKLMFTHREAGESMDVQAVAWTVRGYQERVSK